MSEPRDAPLDDSEARTTGAEPGSSPTHAAGAGEVAGQVIGRYKLLEELGEGGMGTVWMAQQSEPVQRRVALKIIKLGMDTREVVARFEVERQALALMDHPHIAKVLDAGATELGRPYFVMELVRGSPITEFCDQAKLGLRERLELFSQVCHAIQHAHHKGIIHRDVKPSNVLVALQDGTPQPKVIDFGIAKATSANLTQATLYTKLSQVVGTPEYMAPEQTDMGGLDIDTRADVYSLGVLLYELLTGTKPFDLQRSITAGFEEVLRTIREEDPAKPSTRVSTLGESASSIALNRRTQTQVLSKRLRGDLDWIVMRTLEKDRARRYETASALAEDIASFLQDEPVDAAPPSASYRLKKLLRRRKKTVLSLAVIALLLVAGSVGTGIGWWRTSQANQSLDLALTEKARALVQEEQQRRLAEASAQRARSAEAQAREEARRAAEAEASAKARADELEQVATFQSEQLADLDVQQMGVRLRAALESSLPLAERDQLAPFLGRINFTDYALETLRDNLFERTIEAIDRQFVDQPLVQAQLLQSTASTWRELGLLATALDPQARALALRRRELGEEHPDTLTSYNNMGSLLDAQGKFIEAEPYWRRALEGRRRVLGIEHPNTLVSENNMGYVLQAQGKLAEAEATWRAALEISRRVLGSDHEQSLVLLNNIGYLLDTQGRLDEAEALYRESLEGHRRALGNEHPSTLGLYNNMASLLQAQGKTAEAERIYREALAIRRRVSGDEHPNTLHILNNLGGLLKVLGRFEEAEPYWREALEGHRRVLGDDHPHTLTSIFNMGSLFTDMGLHVQAEAQHRLALEGYRRVLGNEDPITLIGINALGIALQSLGELEAAKPLFVEALEARRRSHGDQDPTAQAGIRNLVNVLRLLASAAEEEGDERRQGLAQAELGSFLSSLGRHAEAEEELGEALELFFAVADERDAGPWQLQLQLALAVAGQARFEEAQFIFEECRPRLLARDMKLDAGLALEWPRTHGEVYQAHIDFYAAWNAAEPGQGYGAQAKSWQAELDAWTIAQPSATRK